MQRDSVGLRLVLMGVGAIESRVACRPGRSIKSQDEFGVSVIGPGKRYPDSIAFAGQGADAGVLGALGFESRTRGVNGQRGGIILHQRGFNSKLLLRRVPHFIRDLHASHGDVPVRPDQLGMALVRPYGNHLAVVGREFHRIFPTHLAQEFLLPEIEQKIITRRARDLLWQS